MESHTFQYFYYYFTSLIHTGIPYILHHRSSIILDSQAILCSKLAWSSELATDADVSNSRRLLGCIFWENDSENTILHLGLNLIHLHILRQFNFPRKSSFSCASLGYMPNSVFCMGLLIFPTFSFYEQNVTILYLYLYNIFVQTYSQKFAQSRKPIKDLSQNHQETHKGFHSILMLKTKREMLITNSCNIPTSTKCSSLSLQKQDNRLCHN